MKNILVLKRLKRIEVVGVGNEENMYDCCYKREKGISGEYEEGLREWFVKGLF